ncbi:hypothetical protein [Sporolactobacillus inulinus]|uniref:Uncharacterized protein n=2 Tax=Sporolactobacillus inulinus TaxID=2078 RepID=A0A4Y3T5W1_9BACL|nr:hypothetical protein [Sporolactobacillus inulinus]KLI03368.1 hypothetical protein SINU_03105 [Sporolactobacillus inulinus CASD]GAY75119.1 hypothetical protein NBRC111894_673 [Sporolactobacillus inulinus]GEB76377.1 hypothetical protein SIN01_07220 [Sporolactobacillus inulinus]
MNPDLAAVLSALQANYGFRQLNVACEQPLLIDTERGIKRIRLWTDEALLHLHLKWRNHVKNEHFFVDRMYVTRAGLPSVRFGNFSMTCHDAPMEPLALNNNEQQWAAFLTDLSRTSRDQPVDESKTEMQIQVHTLFEQAKQMHELDPEIWGIVSACYSSACTRAAEADRLREQHQYRRSAFLLPADFSHDSCKALFDTLFFELGQSEPTDGCGVLARFVLTDALQAQRGQSMGKLLQELALKGFFDRENADLMLAEWFAPDEWIRLLQASLQGDVPVDRSSDVFRRVWDQKIKLIRLLENIGVQSGRAGGGAPSGSEGQQLDQSNTLLL